MISLITATLGRTIELDSLLKSLKRQSFSDFELIIIDQNEHHELEAIIEKYHSINIKYYRSDRKGLSINRNIGLRMAKGDIIGFPDDDCFYDDDVLKTVSQEFKEKPEVSLIAFNVKDPNTKESFISWTSSICRKDLCKCCISFNFFIKRNPYIIFDERLGIGAPWGAGEESDYLFSYFNQDDKGLFINDINIYHLKGTGFNKERAYKYGMGMGAIYKKDIFHRNNYSNIIQFINLLIRPLGGILLRPKHAKLYWKTFCGRVNGFITFPK